MQQDFVREIHEDQLNEWLAQHVQTIRGRDVVRDCLVPCDCCGHVMRPADVAYKYRMSRSRVSQLVRRACNGIGISHRDMWGNPT